MTMPSSARLDRSTLAAKKKRLNLALSVQEKKVYWDATIETIKTAKLRELQLRRLKETVARAGRSPFYGERLTQAGVSADRINRLEDLRKIPFTTKADLRARGREMLTVPLTEIVRLHASSGTTGQATVIYYTRRDIETWADLVARSMYMTGVRPGDVFQNMMGYGLFTGGLGFHYGGERLGATVIPSSTGNSKRQLLMIKDLGTTVLVCTPSYAIILHETAKETGFDFRETRLRLGVCGAEPWSEQMRNEIESKLGITAINIYGL